ncbi:hypothetical protein BW41_01009 [Sphingomonas sp. RIT328]|nr:hypothetical protein BW41_01009 [Sphingomonas sp. RIT328]
MMAKRIWAVLFGVVAVAMIVWWVGRRQAIPVTPPPADTGVRVVRVGPPPQPSQPQPLPTRMPHAAPAPLAVPPNPGAGDDPVAQLIPPAGSDPAQLHARFRAEPRDPAWAARNEAGLRNALADVPQIGGGNALAVRCATSLCEVSGTMTPGLPEADGNRTMQALQGDALSRRAATLGLDGRMTSFGSSNGRPTFLLIYTRK